MPALPGVPGALGESAPALHGYRAHPRWGPLLEAAPEASVRGYQGCAPLLLHAGDPRGLRVLDAGCGHGLEAWMAAAAGALVTAVDRAPPPAVPPPPGGAGTIRWVAADLGGSPGTGRGHRGRTGSPRGGADPVGCGFDLVLANASLGRGEAALADVAGRLGPGGRLLYADAVAGWLPPALRSLLRAPGNHLFEAGRPDLVLRSLARAGFREARVIELRMADAGALGDAARGQGRDGLPAPLRLAADAVVRVLAGRVGVVTIEARAPG